MSPKVILAVIALLCAVFSLFMHAGVLLPVSVILCAIAILVP